MTINCTPDSFGAAINALYAKEMAALEKCVDEASKVALGKSYVASEKIIKDKFDKCIDDFYNSYAPAYYTERAYDMYNVLKIKTSEKERLFKYDWDEDSMNQFLRNSKNGSLMELTVGYGFHGGAAGTDHNGETVDVPYYRWPMDKYYWWGNPAFKSESPYDIFMEWFREYFNGEEFRNIYNSYFQESIIDLFPKYMSSI